MLFAAIDGLQDCGYVLTIRIQVCADERELAVEEVRALAKIVCAIALHFDDGILFVRLFLRGDVEGAHALHGVFLGALDGHRISSACRKAILLSASKSVLPQMHGHSVQRSHSSSRRSTATRLRASMVRVAEWSASLHALASASTESAPMK